MVLKIFLAIIAVITLVAGTVTPTLAADGESVNPVKIAFLAIAIVCAAIIYLW